MDDQHIIKPSSSNLTSETSVNTTLLHELRERVEHVAPTLGSRDAQLAHALLSLLTHFHTLSSLYCTPSATPGPSRPVSTLHLNGSNATTSNPLTHLRRHLSDFQLERMSKGEAELSTSSRTPMLAVQTALLWTQIDEQMEIVLSLCRSSFDDATNGHLPPQYDAADYDDNIYVEGLPEYDPGDYESSIRRSKSLDKDSEGVSPTMSCASANEKMRMDLEAVTQAIDHLYEVAPQLHNQRVELKKTKLEQMERARREGKGKQLDGQSDERELERVLELIGKAADRKMVDQSVVMNEDMRARMERTKVRERLKVCCSLLFCCVNSCYIYLANCFRRATYATFWSWSTGLSGRYIFRSSFSSFPCFWQGSRSRGASLVAGVHSRSRASLRLGAYAHERTYQLT